MFGPLGCVDRQFDLAFLGCLGSLDLFGKRRRRIRIRGVRRTDHMRKHNRFGETAPAVTAGEGVLFRHREEPQQNVKST